MDKEYHRQYSRQYRKDYPDKVAQGLRKWRLENKERIKIYNKNYYLKKKAKIEYENRFIVDE